MMRRLLILIAVFLLAVTVAAAEGAEIIRTEEITVVGETITAEDGMSGDALAEGYINRRLYPHNDGGMKRAPKPAGDELEGADANLYACLMTDVARVAAGQLASTQFSYDFEDIYPQVAFTAADLGVAKLRDANGNITSEVRNRITARCTFDLQNVHSALLSDATYELYWYDKTVGISYSRTSSFVYSSADQCVRYCGMIHIRMSVSQDYAAGAYTVDTSYGQAVETAAATARQIVNRYEGLPDYDRLLAYKDEICAMTSYNWDALESNAAYGNPWQLIWVFDGNPATEVVCEGYSKAFKYLNDLSSSHVAVICVDGDALWDGSGGAHMWNLVTMEDGYHYMADITNCDDDTPNDDFFLLGCTDGSVNGGYYFDIPGINVSYYRYESQPYSSEQLTVASWNYTDKPDAPDVTLSSGTGFVGFGIAFLLDRSCTDAASVTVRETGETYPFVNGVAVIPTDTEGIQTLTIFATLDGVPSHFADPVQVEVSRLNADVLAIPESTTAIEAEAFDGTAASMVVIPPSVTSVGPGAFLCMPNLQLIDARGCGVAVLTSISTDLTDAVFCLTDAAAGFSAGVSFVVPIEP